MREVDEAVRQDQLQTWLQRYGKLAAAVFVLALAALGAGLWWQEHRESVREQHSEKLVTSFDALESGRMAEAKTSLDALSKDSGPASEAAARLSLAAIALRENRPADAIREYQAVATDNGAPKPYRDLATIRLVAAKFEDMKPDEVISRLKPLATPGNPWFGSAGELVAMAYLKQGRNDRAGPLLAQIAKDKDVPATLRSRTRQLAGLLGYDAVTDVDQTLTQLRREQSGPAGAAAAAQ